MPGLRDRRETLSVWQNSAGMAQFRLFSRARPLWDARILAGDCRTIGRTRDAALDANRLGARIVCNQASKVLTRRTRNRHGVNP
jgi:hypothetical protein